MSCLCQDVTREALYALSVAVAAKTNAQEELNDALVELEKLKKQNALLLNVVKHLEAIEDSKDLLVAALAEWEMRR